MEDELEYSKQGSRNVPRHRGIRKQHGGRGPGWEVDLGRQVRLDDKHRELDSSLLATEGQQFPSQPRDSVQLHCIILANIVLLDIFFFWRQILLVALKGFPLVVAHGLSGLWHKGLVPTRVGSQFC